MSIKPTVTVITITYNLLSSNREQTIQQCIESVNNQTYKEIEHIIIDGASTDGTLELLAGYEDKGWIGVFSEPDEGVYDAMNKGLKRAKGEYITFLNSDDYYCDFDAISYVVQAFNKTNADYVFGNAECLLTDNNRMPWNANIDLLPYAQHYCHQTLFVKTDVMRKLNGFDTSYRMSADSDLKIRLYKEGYLHGVVDRTYVVFRHGGMSNTSPEQSKQDHSLSFYRHIGRNIGLSHQECIDIWQMHFLNTYTLEQQLEILDKLRKMFSIKVPLERIFHQNADGLAHRINQLETQNTELRTQASCLQEQCDYMLNSSSWKITKPLRTMLTKIRAVNHSISNNLPGIKSRKRKKMIYIGHKYHLHTQSTRFLIELFNEEYDVDEVTYDMDTEQFDFGNCRLQREYDTLVLFQMPISYNALKNTFKFKHRAYIPMYDGTGGMPDSFWEDYRNFKIINFSSTLHNRLSNLGFTSHYIQYYPKPAENFGWGDDESAFFWQRTNQVNINTIVPLLKSLGISKVHMHVAGDPGVEDAQPCEEILAQFNVVSSSWLDTKDDVLGLIKTAAYYIAPRLYEGIGMGFLEAMAMGRCVVAPNHQTMNEYIADGENGLLYDFDNMQRLDKPEDVRTLQKNAYETIDRGYAVWERDKHNILTWLQ